MKTKIAIGGIAVGFLAVVFGLYMTAKSQDLGAGSNTREWVYDYTKGLARSLSTTSGTLISDNGQTSTTTSVALEVVGASQFRGAITATSTLTVTTLGGSGTRCLQTDNDGLFAIAAAACGTGSGGSSSWESLFTNALTPT